MPSIPTLLLASAKRRRRVPEAPTITGITSSNVGELEVAFTAPNDPTEGSSPVTNYEYSVDDGSTWTTRSPVSASSPLTISGLTLGQAYTVRIRAVNEAGFGPQSNSSTGTALGYNVASGGSVSTVNNYLGTGETWRVHTFTSGGTFTVSTSTFPFKVLVVGGGGGGGGGSAQGGTGGGGGGAGGVAYNATASIPVGSRSVTVGGGGGGGSTNVPDQSPTAGGSGGSSSLSGILSAAGGGGGGADPAGCNCDQGQICCPTSPGAGTSNNITGSSVVYARSGPAGGNQCKGCTSSGPGNGGGGGSQGFGIGNYTPDSGFAGIVRVAYRIG